MITVLYQLISTFFTYLDKILSADTLGIIKIGSPIISKSLGKFSYWTFLNSAGRNHVLNIFIKDSKEVVWNLSLLIFNLGNAWNLRADGYILLHLEV